MKTKVWVNHLEWNPVQATLIGKRAASDWPYHIRHGKRQMWWHKVYKTQRQAICALGGEH